MDRLRAADLFVRFQISVNRGTRIAGCVGAVLALPAIANAQNVGPLVYGVVLPGIFLGTVFSVILKFGLLSLPRYRQVRPSLKRFVGMAGVDLAVWALALPSGLAMRFGNRWVYKEYLAVAVGYLANHLAFHRAAWRGARGIRLLSMALVLLLTLSLPLLTFLFALVTFWIGSFISL